MNIEQGKTADLNMLFPEDQLWMIIVGFIVAFVLAFGIGANDVANSFGTSVGAKVLTLRQACILGTIFETLGAMLLGAKVSDTIRKGIIDIAPYNGTEEVLMVGNVCALSGSCIWMLVATMMRMPVSGTHSIVGATMGFALVAHGTLGVNWKKIGMIIASWFISPLMSGLVSVGIFFVVYYFILTREDPLLNGMRFLPVLYGVTLVINLFSIFYEGPEMLYFHHIPIWGTFVISFGGGLICAVLVHFFLAPWQRRRIEEQCERERKEAMELGDDQNDAGSSEGVNIENNTLILDHELEKKNVSDIQDTGGTGDRNEATNSGDASPTSPTCKPLLKNEFTQDSNEHPPEYSTKPTFLERVKAISMSTLSGSKESLDEIEKAKREKSREEIKDKPEAAKLFYVLQILTAIFGSFAHGGNDVSNAIGPLVALWLIGIDGNVLQRAPTPIWILFYGGLGISLGLWIWGRKVIKTLGDDLTKITPSSGFCIEIASALTVLIASNIGIPISTTHCKVGSIVAVGRFRSRENVDWKLFRNIFFAWIVTLL